MCAECGWLELAYRIERHLDRCFVSHEALVLERAAAIIVANQHATPDQIDAIEAVLERREAAAS